MNRPSNLPPGPKAYSDDFDQTPGGFDVDALVLVEGHPKWNHLLRYQNPSSGRTWTVPNAWYNQQRSAQIARAEEDVRRHLEQACSYGRNKAYEREWERLRDRQRGFAVLAELQILLMREELDVVTRNLDLYRKQPLRCDLRADFSDLRAAWECFSAKCAMNREVSDAQTFLAWLRDQWLRWDELHGPHAPGDRLAKSKFDHWLKSELVAEIERQLVS